MRTPSCLHTHFCYEQRNRQDKVTDEQQSAADHDRRPHLFPFVRPVAVQRRRDALHEAIRGDHVAVECLCCIIARHLQKCKEIKSSLDDHARTSLRYGHMLVIKKLNSMAIRMEIALTICSDDQSLLSSSSLSAICRRSFQTLAFL